MTYASLADLRKFGVAPEAVDDDTATEALELADEIIDDHTGASFGPAAIATKTVLGRPGSVIRLPAPFSAITAVSVNGVALDASAWSVDDVGLQIGRYYRDADGYLISSPLHLAFARVAVPIKVTGTFGYGSVPLRVKRAALLLAKGFAFPSSSDTPGPNVKSLSVEGYSITYRDNLRDIDSTGNDDADRLLAGLGQRAYVL